MTRHGGDVQSDVHASIERQYENVIHTQTTRMMSQGELILPSAMNTCTCPDSHHASFVQCHVTTQVRAITTLTPP